MTDNQAPTNFSRHFLADESGWTMRVPRAGFRTVISNRSLPAFPPVLRISRGPKRVILSDFDPLAP